ncbi:MAG: MoaE-MoaD fusion protein [Thermoleophilaceae bacterium]|jgi:molybdopterin synthase catalytic subunit/molybdopterin converting factor small subunit|nr:MoaE-MoaD fusion protein [Thermoleophilaceae bacterium]
MDVSVRLFAMLRQSFGADRVALTLDDGSTVADALDALRGIEGIGGTIALMPLVMAVNRDYAPPETELREGDELALIPPVSGGGGEIHARVTDESLSVDAITRLVSRPEAGAVVTFQGVTRQVARLDYEAYVEMAEPQIARILGECLEAHGALAAAAEHRIGSVPLGEPSVVIAVSGAHRGETFAAARDAIDRIKAEAPIWKAEVEGGDATWVEGAAPETRATERSA